MSDWIPTAERLPTRDEAGNRFVWVTWKDGSVTTATCHNVDASHLAWKPIEDTPEPYVPPKPKRLKRWIETSSNKTEHLFRQVLDGDPDPDVVLEVLSEMKSTEEWGKCQMVKWLTRILGSSA